MKQTIGISRLNAKRTAGKKLLSAIAGLGILAAAIVVPASAAQAAPLQCLTPTIYIAQSENPDGSGSTQLYSETYQLGQAVFTEVGDPWGGQTGTGGRYNAIGFNPTDRQMYAISGVYDLAGVPTYDLLQIDEDGTVNNLGPVDGLPTNSAFINAGAFINGDYYVGSYFSTELYRVDVTTAEATVVPLATEFTVADFTPVQGYLWGTTLGGNIERIDPVAGTVTQFSLGGVVAGDDTDAGAAFTFGNGNLGISSSANGIVTQLAIGDAGSATPTFTVVNQAEGPTSARNDGTSCLPANPDTDLSVEKTGPAFVAPGGTISWTVSVTNAGPAISSGYTVNDIVPAGVTGVTTSTPGCSVAGASMSCVGSTLAVGDSFDVVLTGTAPAVDGTCVTNNATVTSNEPDVVPGNNSDDFETCVSSEVADFTFDKIATLADTNGNDLADVGETIAYAFTVTNTGTVTLTGLAISDPLGGTVTCDDTTLAPLATTDCATNSDYLVTLADAQNGSVVNVATATFDAPANAADPGSREDTTTTPTGAVPVADFTFDKVATPADPNGNDVADVGETIAYSFTVTNTGNVPLTGLAIDDPLGGTVTCDDTTLAPLATTECTTDADYVVTTADAANGSVVNVATATVVAPDGVTNPGPREDTTTTPTGVVPVADFTMEMQAILADTNGNGVADAGETIAYTYLVTNTGNVPLTELSLTDPQGGSITCPDTTLAPLASTTCVLDVDHVVTAADVANGSIVRPATATVVAPDGVTNPGLRDDTTAIPTGTAPVPAPPSATGGLADTGSAMAGMLGGLGLTLILGSAAFLLAARLRNRTS